MNFSNVTIAGNLTRDPEHKELANDNSVCNFTVAVNGYKKDDVSFVDVTAWGKTAEFVNNHFSRGKGICVVGELVQDNWDDKETGKKRSKIYVNARNVYFFGKKEDVGEAVADDQHVMTGDIPF